MKSKKTGLMDMHCHLLFGVDDGAKTIEDSMKMLETAYNDGIRAMILTPHYHPRRGMAHYADVINNFQELKYAASRNFPDMQLFLGREVYFRSDITENEQLMEELKLCNTNNILVEFSTSVDSHYLKSAVSNLMIDGYQPVIAHIERYGCVVKDREIARELKMMGAYIQINADSLVSGGFVIKQFCKKLLKNGFVDFIGSDAHDCTNRPPVLSKCYGYIQNKFGENIADRLMCDNPMRIVNDELD